MAFKDDFGLLLIFSIIIIGLVGFNQWRKGVGSVGLVTLYLLGMFQHYWLPTSLYAIPGYLPIFPEFLAKLGLQQFVIGLLGLALGSIVIAPRLRVRQNHENVGPMANEEDIRAKLPRIYIILGLVTFFVLGSLVRFIPSAASVTSNMEQFFIVGIVLGYWQAWRRNDRTTASRFLMLVAGWPLVTVALHGFLGAGLNAVFIVLMFVFQLIRRPLKMLFYAFLVGYLLLSLYITYMGNRNAIRSVAWNQDASLSQRAQAVYLNLKDFEWFNWSNLQHIYLIDGRAGQMPFTGMAIQNIANGRIGYAGGTTMFDAVLMMVPRIIWPGKPVRIGGNAFVSMYTGMRFLGDTSVSAGELFEYYVNFGTVGVFVGFLIFGVVLTLVDTIAAHSLQVENGYKFAFWYIIGLALIQPGNTLTAITGMTAAAAVTATLVNRYLLPVLFSLSKQSGTMNYKSRHMHV